jgi:hypothetical protein
MKKLFLMLIALIWSATSYAQTNINVRLVSDNERLYFGNSHEWMIQNGYQYNPSGYYIGNNRRIYPNRREFYNTRNKTWGKHNGSAYMHRKPQHNKGYYKSNNGRKQNSHYNKKGKR